MLLIYVVIHVHFRTVAEKPNQANYQALFCIFVKICYHQLCCKKGHVWQKSNPRYLSTYIMQLKIWKQFIAWEKRNPTRTESNALLVKRG